VEVNLFWNKYEHIPFFSDRGSKEWEKNLTLEKQSIKVKMLESIRRKKEVQENLTFAYDSVETENKNKKVLECQRVTTS